MMKYGDDGVMYNRFKLISSIRLVYLRKSTALVGVLCVVIGLLLSPTQVVYAEAEDLYVQWFDLDYMDPNPVLAWFESAKDYLLESAALNADYMNPESNWADQNSDVELPFGDQLNSASF